jgi:hypothetical protein
VPARTQNASSLKKTRQAVSTEVCPCLFARRDDHTRANFSTSKDLQLIFLLIFTNYFINAKNNQYLSARQIASQFTIPKLALFE